MYLCLVKTKAILYGNKTESNQIYSPIRDKWLVLKPEEEVRQRYVCRLVDSYGYGIKQMGEEVKVTNSQRGQGAARADIVIWRNEEDKRKGKNALIVVECKAENVTIRQADYFKDIIMQLGLVLSFCHNQLEGNSYF